MTGFLWVGACLLLVGVFSLTHAFARKPNSILAHAFRSYEAMLNEHAHFVQLPWSGSRILRAQLAVLVPALALCCARPRAPIAVSLALVCMLPTMLLRSGRRRRVSALEQQLDGWLLMFSNALKSTASAADAFISTAALVPSPFNEEVRLIAKELRFGVPFDRALQEAGRRIGSATISSALMLIVVARRSGADLSSTLAHSSAALRESARLEGVLRTKTAEGRGQVTVLALVPFLLCFLIASLDASWFEPMLSHARGHAIIVLCVSIWAVAIGWAHRIVSTAL